MTSSQVEFRTLSGIRAFISKKETSDKMSQLASAVLRGAIKPTPAQSRSLAAGLLSQDEHRGQRPVKPKGK